MKALFISFLFQAVCASCFCQNTTQEEYNFMAKGFKAMVESGLDMKKGYYLRDTLVLTASEGKYNIHFVKMLREKDKSLAGIISIVKSQVWDKTYFLAIPAADQDGHIDLETTLMRAIASYYWDSNAKTAFLQSLAEYMSMNLTKQYMQKIKR
jgi:hypothetical protein